MGKVGQVGRNRLNMGEDVGGIWSSIGCIGGRNGDFGSGRGRVNNATSRHNQRVLLAPMVVETFLEP